MPAILSFPLAAAGAFPWVNLVWVLVGIAGLLFTVASLGRWLAATHPDPVARPGLTPAGARSVSALAPETAAAIAAAVHETLGSSAQVTAVVLQPPQPVSVENLMLTWSLEGRRQIYTSHKVR